MPEQPGVQVCGQCGRRVPRTVTTCRCGATLPALAHAAGASDSPGSGSVHAEGRGSAFFVAPDTLLTNVHVVGNSSSVTIKRLGGAASAARVERRAAQFDLAVLKLPSGDPSQPTIALASAASARPGQEVIAIGSALGTLQNTVTRGIVSGLRESGGVTLVQTDAAVNPGNSGGPLLNRDGQAIGITTMGYAERQGLNFAVAADHARALVDGRPTTPVVPGAPRAPEVQGLSPAVPTAADRARSDGARAYQDAIAAAAQRAHDIDNNWARFKASCYGGPLPGGFEREWFVLFDPRGLSGAVAPGCNAFYSDLRQYAATIADAVLKAEEAARQAGVYPGVRRDARRLHRLDYPGWER